MKFNLNEQNKLKKLVAKAAFEQFIKPDMIVGVGTGSTVNFFIEKLSQNKDMIKGVVSSSKATTELLKKHNFEIYELNNVDLIDIYIDGADEINDSLQMIKGGGAALTGEKIVSSVSKRFVCIVDESKKVSVLGKFPLPIEVIPMARSYVARQMVKLGGTPNWRNGVITDYGNSILDVYNLNMLNPVELEKEINQISGVVTNGIFAIKPADNLVMATYDSKIKLLTY